MAAAAARLGAAFVSERVSRRRRSQPGGPGAARALRGPAGRRGDRPHDGRPGRDGAAATCCAAPAATGRPPCGPAARHPLLGLRRSETAGVCRAMGLEPVVDPSNDDPRHLRNRVRHELLPLCAELVHRDPVPLLARHADVLRAESALLDDLARHAVPEPSDAARSWPARPSRWRAAPCGPGSPKRPRRVPPIGTRPRWPRSNGCSTWRPAGPSPPSCRAAAGCAGARAA